MTASAVWVALGWAALGGGAGAALRHAVDRWVTARWRGEFPLGILLVNVSGSFALGLLLGAASGQVNDVVTVLGTGLLGGYTTFSTASYDTVRFARAGRVGTALVHGVGTMVATVAVATVGLWVGGALWPAGGWSTVG